MLGVSAQWPDRARHRWAPWHPAPCRQASSRLPSCSTRLGDLLMARCCFISWRPPISLGCQASMAPPALPSQPIQTYTQGSIAYPAYPSVMVVCLACCRMLAERSGALRIPQASAGGASAVGASKQSQVLRRECSWKQGWRRDSAHAATCMFCVESTMSSPRGRAVLTCFWSCMAGHPALRFSRGQASIAS